MQPMRPHVHLRAVDLDHHVADLAGGAAADPRSCRRGSARRRRRCPRRHRARRRTRAPRPARTRPGCRRSRRARALTVLDAARRGNGRAERELAGPVGRDVARLGDGALRCSSTAPGEPMPTPASADGSTPAPSAASASAATIPSATPCGPLSFGVGWRACPSTWWSSSTMIAWILVPPRSIPPRSRSHPVKSYRSLRTAVPAANVCSPPQVVTSAPYPSP